MYNVWFERPMPAQFTARLDGLASIIEPVTNDPYHSIETAHAAVASVLPYTAAVMDRAPELLVISRTGIGYDAVDVAAATARGIAVCNAPDGPTISTAEHAITLMMAVARQLKKSEYEIRHDRKEDFYGAYVGIELYGKRLGLVGIGRIGSHVAKVANALGMTVIAYDPYVSAQHAADIHVELMPSLEALLRSADIVSLHAPLTDETRHLINRTTLAQMKAGAILVNTSRGGVVDEAALIDALESGHLFGAGLDVTEVEPPAADHPLLGFHNVILTPHIASGTEDGKARIREAAVLNVVQLLRGEQPPNLINKAVWPQVAARLKR